MTYIIGAQVENGNTRVGTARRKERDNFGQYRLENSLNPRFDLKDYGHFAVSQDDSDFSWGPKFQPGHLQLSLAILAFVSTDTAALNFHVKFAAKVIAKMESRWVLSQDKARLILHKLGGELIIQEQEDEDSDTELPGE